MNGFRLAILASCFVSFACGESSPPDSVDSGGGGHGSGADGDTVGEPLGGGGGLGGSRATLDADCVYHYRQGHGDLHVGYSGTTGTLQVNLKTVLSEAPGDEDFDPAEVCIHVPYSTYESMAAAEERPEGPAWDPLGVDPGSAFWFIPASPVAGVPWFGLSTEGVPLGSLDEDKIRLTYRLVESPKGGHLSQYAVSSFGVPDFSLSTSTGLLTYERKANAHEHLSWSFSMPGEWVLEARARGELSTGGFIESRPAYFRFVVERE